MDYFKKINNIKPNFDQKVGYKLTTSNSIDTLQVNITYKCNLACKHCHVGANPNRTEDMSIEVAKRVIEILKLYDFKTLDITGGAPEMSGVFKYLIEGAKKLDKHIILRSNLTIYNDKAYKDIPLFLKENEVEIVASLPFYEKDRTDKMRGLGVFKDSIQILKILNKLGYATDDKLILNLVYNPSGAYIPDGLDELEKIYRVKLKEEYNIAFNNLLAITNSPIGNFGMWLDKSNNLDRYLNRLISSFNKNVLDDLMCRNTLSIDYKGDIYDCDFNQALGIKISSENKNIFDLRREDLFNRKIATANHCYSCTAGAGSS